MSFLKGIFGNQQGNPSSSSSQPSNPYPGQANRHAQQPQPTVALPPGYQERPTTPHRTNPNTPVPTRAAPPAKQHPSHLISANQAAGLAASARHATSTSNGVTNRPASGSVTSARPPHVPFSHAAINAAAAAASNEQKTSPPPPYQPRSHSNADSDMFGGMAVKTSQSQPQQQQQPAAAPPSGGGGGGFDMDDMFSGLTLSGPTSSSTSSTPASSPTPTHVQQETTTSETSEQAPSLLHMISTNGNGTDHDDASSSHDDTASEAASGFGFMSESTQQDEPVDDTPASTTSAFNFMPQQDRPVSLDVEPGAGLDLDGMTIKAETPVPQTPSSPPGQPTPSQPTPSQPTPSQPTPSQPTPVPIKSAPEPPTDTVESVTSRLTAAQAHYWSTLERLNVLQSQIRQQELSLTTTLRETQEKLKEAEREQARAIAEEEYENAEMLNQEMEKYKSIVTRSTTELSTCQNKLISNEQEKEKATREMLDVVASSNAALIRLKSKQVSEMTSYVTEHTTILEKEEDQLNTDMDRVERSLAHTKQDLELVQNEQDQIDAMIESETKDLATEKLSLEMEQEKLQNELDELLRQVYAKEEEISMNKQKSEVCGTKIASVRAGHEKKLKRIHEKRERYVEEQNRAESEASALTRRRQQLESDSQSIRERENGYKSVIKNISEEINSAHLVAARLQYEEKRRSQWKQSHQQDQQNITSLQQQLETITNQLDEYRNTLLHLETSANTHHKTIANVNQKIPTLEADKKLAVTARDFKNAAKYSADIKTLQTNKSEAEQNLEELKIQVADTQSRIAQASESKTTIQNQIVAAQDLADLHRYHMLAKNERSLKTLLARAESALTIAIDAGTGSPALASEASSLRTELSVVTSEMLDLTSHHTWSDQQLHVVFDNELNDTLEAPGPEPTDVPDRVPKKRQEKVESKEKEQHDEEPSRIVSPVLSPSMSPRLASPQSTSPQTTSPQTTSPQTTSPRDTPATTITTTTTATPTFDAETSLTRYTELQHKQKSLEAELEACIEREEYDRAESIDDEIRLIKEEMTSIQSLLTQHGVDVPSSSSSQEKHEETAAETDDIQQEETQEPTGSD